MERDDYLHCLQLLELSPDANMVEVKSAYQQLREVYASSNSIALSSIEDEFPDSSRQRVLQDIEEVYRKLMTHFAENSRGGERTVIQLVTDRDDLATFIASITNFSGPVLRQIREKRRVDLRDVAQSSKIRKGYLVDIELENFSTLPSEIYLKGYLTSYAQFFGLDSRRVVEDYMRRYRSWQESRA